MVDDNIPPSGISSRSVSTVERNMVDNDALALVPWDMLSSQDITLDPPIRPKRGKSEAQRDALRRAEGMKTKLPIGCPSLIKCMVPSNVTIGFSLRFPKAFCQEHLPESDSTIILEDGSEKKYEVKYLAVQSSLSSGWRRFALDHNLLETDVLIFQLVGKCIFKVYIVRSQVCDEVDAIAGLLKLEDGTAQKDEEDVAQGDDPKKSGMITCAQSDQFTNTSKGFCNEVWDGNTNFSIGMNDIDLELSDYYRAEYNKLCCSQRSLLHDGLRGRNSKLVAGIISETIDIAYAIKDSKLTTSPDSFTSWNKILKSFEDLGMNVSFLLNRLDDLMTLAFKFNRFKEATRERSHAEEHLKVLEAELSKVKCTIEVLDGEIASLDIHSQRPEILFEELVNAPL